MNLSNAASREENKQKVTPSEKPTLSENPTLPVVPTLSVETESTLQWDEYPVIRKDRWVGIKLTGPMARLGITVTRIAFAVESKTKAFRQEDYVCEHEKIYYGLGGYLTFFRLRVKSNAPSVPFRLTVFASSDKTESQEMSIQVCGMLRSPFYVLKSSVKSIDRSVTATRSRIEVEKDQNYNDTKVKSKSVSQKRSHGKEQESDSCPKLLKVESSDSTNIN